MKLVAISGTNEFHRSLESPDGELTRHRVLDGVREFIVFLRSLTIVIAGKHDLCFENHRKAYKEILTNCIYLHDQEVIIAGLKLYGNPWQPCFYVWAFNLERGPEIWAKWELISKDTDVLISHGPPCGIRNLTTRGKKIGCADLLEIVEEIENLSCISSAIFIRAMGSPQTRSPPSLMGAFVITCTSRYIHLLLFNFKNY
jgi:hypothetical protein